MTSHTRSPWQKIIAILARAVSGAGFAASAEMFTMPPDPTMGDVSLPCFDLAKTMKKPPAIIATDIQSAISNLKSAIIDRVEAKGPYVNFFLESGTLAELTLNTIAKSGTRYGISRYPSPRPSPSRGEGVMSASARILFEYSQPNTHKEFHVGHLRNVCLGWSLAQLWQAVGHKVTGITYVNDVGMHVAKCLWGLKKFHRVVIPNDPESPPKAGAPLAQKGLPVAERGRFLGHVYAEAAQALSAHPEWKKEADALLAKLEARDPQTIKLWKETRKWSLDGFSRIYRSLGVKFDRAFYESDIKDRGREIVEELLARGIATRSEGAVIADLRAYGLDVLLLLKSDGTGLYSTSDLALVEAKRKKYPRTDESMVLIDRRQDLYFKQLFKTLELAGGKTPKLAHLTYELVTLPEGGMSSRKGKVVLYEDLEDEVAARAREETRKRHADWQDKKVQATARAIALAAIKFTMLRRSPGQVVVFDPKESLAFEGFTGPYLLYTAARINSILEKSNKRDKRASEISERSKTNKTALRTTLYALRTNEEHALLLLLARFPDVVRDAATANDPSLVCKYLFGLAKTFSDFYEKCPVLKAEHSVREARLALLQATGTTITNGLRLLGIPAVKEM